MILKRRRKLLTASLTVTKDTLLMEGTHTCFKKRLRRRAVPSKRAKLGFLCKAPAFEKRFPALRRLTCRSVWDFSEHEALLQSHPLGKNHGTDGTSLGAYGVAWHSRMHHRSQKSASTERSALACGLQTSWEPAVCVFKVRRHERARQHEHEAPRKDGLCTGSQSGPT